MATWRIAKSLQTLLAQVNEMYPGRDKSSDGTIGDTRHQQEHSDHNPNKAGVVCALDITHDPASGCDSFVLAETLRQSKDKRIQYVISNKRIANADSVKGLAPWAWRPYNGSDPHTGHLHLSVKQAASVWDITDPWDIGDKITANPNAPKHVYKTVRNGSRGDDVSRAQYLLGLTTDGIFGGLTDKAVREFQKSHSLTVDGVVGPETWAVLEGNVPAQGSAQTAPVQKVPASTSDRRAKIFNLINQSGVVKYHWKDRGVAPIGYIKGVCLVYDRLLGGSNPPAVDVMSKQVGNSSWDALGHYQIKSETNRDALRHTFALLMGLGMRESSGNYTEGRDLSARNVTADTAEAGLFQQSWNSNVASGQMQELLRLYTSSNPPNGLEDVFKEGVKAKTTSNYGAGQGKTFQELCKSHPAFAVECAAIGLRVIRQHWGPINRKEAEFLPEVDQLLFAIQNLGA